MFDVDDIQPLADNCDIDRLELILAPVSCNEAVAAVIDQNLIAPGIRHVLGAVGVYGYVDRSLHAPAARAGY